MNLAGDNGRQKAMIAMSGGVDSSVAAALMKRQGYDCIGAMMKLYENKDIVLEKGNLDIEGGGKTCCSADDAADAAAVAGKLDIPFYVFRFTEAFRCQVMERFVNSYVNGETPNPCIDCNRYMKFEKLYQQAKMLECEKIATGHYARINYDAETGRWQMKKAIDRTKDQSYVLYSLTQEQLSHVCFPLGELTKEEVRGLAQEYGFFNAEKRDSQDICFVPDGHYEKFIEQYRGEKVPEGNFVSEDGEVLGKHKGIIYYTVGQRKGLGIAAAFPYYVKEIRPESNEVILGKHDSLFQRTLLAKDVNWVSIPGPDKEIRVQAKIRYRHKAEYATAQMRKDGLLRVTFDKPQRAITKGQSVVLYDGELVLGGGKICGTE